MRTADGTRERLREIEAELAELAVGAAVPSDREVAQALLLEAKRIEPVTSGSPQAR
jgi:hypothetical protein